MFGFSSLESVVATSLLCNSLLVAGLEEEVVAPIPVTRVSNGKGGWADLILTKDSAASALLLSSLA